MSRLEGMISARLGRCNLFLAMMLAGAFAMLGFVESEQADPPMWPWVLAGASPCLAGIGRSRLSWDGREEQPECLSPALEPSVDSHRPRPLPAGKLLCDGRYEVDAVIGRGGFGITYSGRDVSLGRRVAIKECLPPGCRRLANTVTCAAGHLRQELASKLEDFRHEGRVLAHLGTHGHSGLVASHGAFEENGTAYVVMEFVEGKTLYERVKERGAPLPEDEALAYVQQVAEALSVVHELGYVHLDVKPDNVMITPSGRAVLIDFGNARRLPLVDLRGHNVALTPGFAAMEQYQEKAARGPFSDVYGLAATLYYALCAEAPPAAPERTRGDSLPDLQELNGVSPHVARAIERGMAMNATRRPRTTQHLMDELAVPPTTRRMPVRIPGPSRSAEAPWLGAAGPEPASKGSPNMSLIIRQAWSACQYGKGASI